MRSRRTGGHRAAGSTGRGDGQRVRRPRRCQERLPRRGRGPPSRKHSPGSQRALSHPVPPPSARRARRLHPPTLLPPLLQARPALFPTRRHSWWGTGAQQGRDPLKNRRGAAGARPPAPQPLGQMQAAASGPLPGPASPPRIPPARALSAARPAQEPGAPLTHQGADLGPAPAPGSRLRGSSSLRPPRLPGTPPPQADPGSYCSASPSR